MYGIRKIWKPEIFQGAKREKNYFEGWYFKCISRDETEGHVFIPGIALSGKDSHAFLQVFDGKHEKYRYLSYPLDAFTYSKKDFVVNLGKSSFSSKGIHLDVDTPEAVIRGDVTLGGLSPWPVTVFSPGAMGWYAFVPKMEDYHGVISFHHPLEGRLTIDGSEIDLSGGKGYIEKDWGTSFPTRWIWMQTNNFSDKRASLSLSVATIPWRNGRFTGYIIGFWLDGRLFRFSTYSGGKIEEYKVVSENEVRLVISSKNFDLAVSGVKIGGTDLKAPLEGLMAGHVHESLKSEIEVKLTERMSGGIVFSGKGTSAGIELHGDIQGLLEEAVNRK